MNCHSVFNCSGHNHELTSNRLIKETVLSYVNEAEFKELFTITALEKIETVTSSAITATSSAIKASLDARNAVNDLTSLTLDFVSDAINGFNDDIGEVIKSLGFITIDSFELGATITQRNQALRHTDTGKLYRWAGNLPKIVPTDSTPMNSGGIANNAWLEVSDATLRSDIVTGGLISTALTKTVPIEGTLGEARTQLDKNRESVSVFDFFTSQELQQYEENTETFDAHRPLQAFFDYIYANNVGVAHCSGYFHTSKGIVWGGVGNNSATKAVVGEFVLRAIYPEPIDVLLAIQCGRYCKWIGGITVRGRGATVYSIRNVNVGIMIGSETDSTAGAAHFNIDSIDAEGGFKDIGVYVANWATNANLGSTRALLSGSGVNAGDYSVKSPFSVKSTNNTGGLSQNSVITVENLPLEGTRTGVMLEALKYNSDDPDETVIYYVDSIDRDSKELTIRPALPSHVQSGELIYYFGAGIYVTGNDTANVRFGKVSGTGSGVLAWFAAQYQPMVTSFVGEFNGIALALGKSVTGSSLGGIVQAFYAESHRHDVVRLAPGPYFSFTIASSTTLNWGRFTRVTRVRSNITDKIIGENQTFAGLTAVGNGKVYTVQNWGVGDVFSIEVDVSEPNTTAKNIWKNNGTIRIKIPDKDAVIKSGNSTVEVICNTGVGDGTPTGTITVQPPEGYTLNGVAGNISFTRFLRPPKFTIVYNPVLDAFTVSTPDYTLSNTKVVTFPAIPAGSVITDTITLAGVKLADPVVANFNKNLSGARMWAEVTSSDTVTVYIKNETEEELSALSGSLRVQKLPSSF